MTPEEKQFVKWFRNPQDRFLVEVGLSDDTEETSTFKLVGYERIPTIRRTTNNLQTILTHVNFKYKDWLWMNVYYRWQDWETAEMKYGQIASYTPRYVPFKSEPTQRDLYQFAMRMAGTGGSTAALDAYTAIEINKRVSRM